MRPLVILHGLFGSSKNWTTISKRITAEIPGKKVHAIDLKNQGQANIQAVNSWKCLQEDLEYFWKHELDRSEFDLLGHSFGGQVAMSSVLSSDSVLREAVKKLIVVDVSLRYPSAHLKDSDDKMYRLMLKMCEINTMKFDKKVDVENELRKEASDENVINFLMMSVSKIHYYGFHRIGVDELIKAWPILKETWKQGFVPWNGESLFLKGENSDYIRTSDEPEIKDFFPNSKIESVSKSGHWPHFDNQDEFIQKLIKFIK